jgi:SAM-dependent methyltransferase
MYKDVTECRCCGSSELYTYLDLGDQPLANSYHKGEELDRFPLKVNLCKVCFHSQLGIVVEPSLMFKNYLYVSGTTHTFRDHCKALAEDAVTRLQTLHPRVLDIACNDGTLLGYFRELGCEVQGIDPAENLREITKEKDIPVEVGYWGSGMAAKVNGPFDIITGTNVFAHVDNVGTFLDECVEVLSDEGMIILEFPYCDELIAKCEFDTIYHEHLSYFLVHSMSALAFRKELTIFDVVQTPIHGGSIRFFLAKGNENCDKVQSLIGNEYVKGLLDTDTYHCFGEKVERSKADTLQLLQRLRSEGYKIVAFGASAKGNTMLNYFELDLDYIVDDNEMKWGYLTPGRDIPICSPEEMRKESGNLAVVILSWNFAKEIIEKLQNIRPNSDDVCVFYVPKVEVSPLN